MLVQRYFSLKDHSKVPWSAVPFPRSRCFSDSPGQIFPDQEKWAHNSTVETLRCPSYLVEECAAPMVASCFTAQCNTAEKHERYVSLQTFTQAHWHCTEDGVGAPIFLRPVLSPNQACMHRDQLLVERLSSPSKPHALRQ
jgi:hypothetical protein